MKNSKGKGPFARRAGPAKGESVRWVAPPTELLPENVEAFFAFARRRCDAGVTRLFEKLANMRPPYRLARNLAEIVRILAKDDVTDALQHGLNTLEKEALIHLEELGVELELLGVAHALLDVRARQRAVVEFGDTFFTCRRQHFEENETS